ncbi:hypothetical protein [Streptomyces sp. NPDC097981]|uniref:hypothetical protein n=1 Tax=Streptomyces sp. NPDC097981 TaxID=3155428 RepID=UPI003319D2BB
MAREFEVRREQDLLATPEQVWDAVATGPGNLGWLYPMEAEPRVGGKATRGDATDVAWEPPRHFAVRATQDGGFSNTLTYRIEPGDGGRATCAWESTGCTRASSTTPGTGTPSPTRPRSTSTSTSTASPST